MTEVIVTGAVNLQVGQLREGGICNGHLKHIEIMCQMSSV